MNLVNLKTLLTSNRGQGIVSVIVAAGVGAIVLGFLTDMLVKQGISQKFISQKLEMNDLSGNLITTFSKANNCTCQFSADAAVNPNSDNSAGLEFNSTVTDGSQFIDVKKLYAGCKVGGQMPLLIAEEGLPLPTSSSLRVDKVQFVNLRPTGGAVNEWQGQWSITFQVGAGSAIRSVRPVLVSQKVTINPANSPNSRITACSGLSTGSGTLNFLAKWSPISGVLEDTGVFEGPTGKIGIGTTAPQSIIHIKKNDPDLFRLDRSVTTASGPALDFYDSFTPVGPLGQIVTVQNAAGEDGANMLFYTKPNAFAGLGAPKLGLTHDGRMGLGLGVSTPDSKLHVKQTVDTNFGGIQITNVAGGPGTGANTSFFLDASNKTHIGGTYTSPDAIVIDNATGKIGLGSTNPTSGLEIFGSDLTYTKGTITIGYNGQVAKSRFGAGFGAGGATAMTSNLGYNSANSLLLDNTTKPAWSFLIGEPGDAVAVYRFPPQSNPIGSTPGPFFVINSAGNVGIGTSAPISNFHTSYIDTDTGIGSHSSGVMIENRTPAVNGRISSLQFRLNDGQPGKASRSGIFAVGNATDGLADLVIAPSYDGAAGNPTERMRITSGGNVGIGNSNPSYTLDVNGNARATGSVAAWSDIRAKKNIRPIENSLDKLSQINGVEFDWRLQEFPDKKFKTTRDIGVIAQEVEKVFPEIVETAPDGYKSVAYSLFVVPIIEAIKELKKLVQELFVSSNEQSKNITFLKSDYVLLKIENKELKARLDQQEKELAAIKNKLGI